ncbi:MAG: 1-aminocyclopropane-1-carboxylate deaminase/D-cysteine desulfhydrase [Planctomycetota bacterium]
MPTPVHRLDRLSERIGRDVYVWRDDLTGCLESGNKVRKLEFLLAEARRREATTVVTCGGVQSNHVRATVFAARQLGMGVSAIVREPPEGVAEADEWTGNWLLDRMAGARLRRVPFAAYREAGSVYDPFLAEEAARLEAAGERPYVIPEGGTCPLGCWGYLRAVPEMLRSWSELGLGPDGPDAVFLALGSGGTHAGLVLGYAAEGLDPARVHAVNVCNDRAYFEARVGRLLADTARAFGLSGGAAPLDIIDGHVGRGYARTTGEELRFFCDVAREEGVLLDPCYTGKAFRGMLHELETRPERYGERVLFLHSGGAFSIFAYVDQLRGVL